MRTCLHAKAIPAVVAVAMLFVSCEMPSDHNNPKPEIYEVHIIRSDGSSDHIIATGNYALGVLTDSLVIVRNDLTGLSVATYAGSSVTPLFPDLAWFNASLSKDRTKVLLTSYVSSLGGSFLYLMDPNGSNLVQLGAPMRSYGSAILSPQMDEVAFRNSNGLYTMNIDGSNLQRIRRSSDSAYGGNPLYVDQDRIVYTEDSVDFKLTHLPMRAIRLYSKSSHRDTALFNHSNLFYLVDETNPLAGETLLCKDNALKACDLRTGSLSMLPSGLWGSFSPDGTLIVIVSTDSKSLLTMDLRNQSTQTVYTVPDSKKWISFAQISPDNKYIVFLAAYQAP